MLDALFTPQDLKGFYSILVAPCNILETSSSGLCMRPAYILKDLKSQKS